MVLLGAIFKCLDPILILAAIESSRTFFLSPPGSQDRSHDVRSTMSLGQQSDHLALLNGFREWRFIKATRGLYAANEFAWVNLMHTGALQNIEKTSEQMLELLVNWGLAKDIPIQHRYNNELGDPELNLNSDVQPLILALFSAGLTPNFAVQTGFILLQTSADAKAMIHPNSLNNGGRESEEKKSSKKSRFIGAGPPGTLVLFSSKSVSNGGVFLKDTTVIAPMTGLMFSKVSYSRENNNIVYVDDWIPMRFEFGGARTIYDFSKCLANVTTFLISC